MYVIKDMKGEIIDGAFYEEELQKTIQDKEVELLFWKIDFIENKNRNVEQKFIPTKGCSGPETH